MFHRYKIIKGSEGYNVFDRLEKNVLIFCAKTKEELKEQFIKKLGEPIERCTLRRGHAVIARRRNSINI
jgi:hypothetical protein